MRLGLWLVLATAALSPPQAVRAADAWTTRPDLDVYYRIAADSFGLGNADNDTMLVSRETGADGQKFWAAERWRARQTPRKPPVQRHVWLDGRACPALENALRALADLPAAKFGRPSDMDQAGLAFDGGTVVVSGPGPGPRPGAGVDLEGRGGRMLRLTEHAGPVVAWWSWAEPALESCWRQSPHLQDGVVLKSRMANKEEAERQKP